MASPVDLQPVEHHTLARPFRRRDRSRIMRRVASSMKLGFSLPVAGAWATPANQVSRRAGGRTPRVPLALGAPAASLPGRAAERLPADARARRGRTAFESVADPVVSLAFVAGVTSRIRLGTSVLVMPYYTPVVLAKQLATLDQVSEGRLDVGLGVGWSRDEYDAVGVPFDRRGPPRRRVPRLPEGRSGPRSPVEFHGEFYRVPRAYVRPRPLQDAPPADHHRRLRGGRGAAGGHLRRRLQRRQHAARPRRAARDGAPDGRGARRAGPARLQVVCRGTFRPFEDAAGPGPATPVRLARRDPRRHPALRGARASPSCSSRRTSCSTAGRWSGRSRPWPRSPRPGASPRR